MTEEAVLTDVAFTKGTPTVYPRQTSIHHWQLRDLISAADNEHQFYSVHETCIYKYDASTKQSEVVSQLRWAPNSMTRRGRFIAAGGLRGELEVCDLLSQEVCFKGQVGSTVNNALHIAEQPQGETWLYVCCNDSSIQVFKLPSMQVATVIRCPCPINYASLSPDGQHLVAVGDCNPTLIYQATPAGYTLLSSFTEASDVGMCCAWNCHGSMFASCAQDGSVGVWEQRTGRCLARLSLAPAAARCVKFSAAPVDLLAVSEHEDRVHLVDARRWASRQTLDLAAAARTTAARTLDVSGIAFTPSGQRLWVGLEQQCLAYQIDCLKRRTHSCADIL